MRPGGTLKPTTVLHSSALRSASPALCPPGTCGYSRLSTPYSTTTYRLVSVSADLLRVCGRSDRHLRRAQGRMAGPQARAPLPPFRWRGSGSGPLADGTPPSPRNSSDVRRAHRLSMADSDVNRRGPATQTAPPGRDAPDRRRRQPRAGTPPPPVVTPPAPPAAVETVQADTAERTITVDNGVVRAVFSNRGATLAAWELLNYAGPGRQARRSRAARRSRESAEAVFVEARRCGEDCAR